MPELEFGVMIDTSSGSGEEIARAARSAEALGFGVVAVHPDHPSSAGTRATGPSVECWTAITWILAATTRIRALPSVLSMAYRHPGVVAKMAESLDRLSGGRLILGLGAGGDDRATRAFGLPERTPTAKVALLSEAIDVMTGLWEQAPFTYEGRAWHMDAASINPLAVRRPPIWLGAYGDRMLDLVAARADGWLPSYHHLDRRQAKERLERIAERAASVGRDRAELTFACNVPLEIDPRKRPSPSRLSGSAEEVAEHLACIAEAGFDTLVLWPVHSQPDALEELAKEVIPVVRER
ncbi:LLM class flavin-dependent oxidoreductase [Streptomyces sp. NPDC086549]|uniref:LLM class flavin-dependent oxidoreductase n=1 Tax=Streptomyces sp. NPDC086549 TaxID=3365752 RepID=UPI00381252AC